MQLRGQLTLQFRAELFNVLNRANFRAPSAITFTPSGLRYRRADHQHLDVVTSDLVRVE